MYMQQKLINNHIEAHKIFPDVAAIGGSVEPSSSYARNFNLWEF